MERDDNDVPDDGAEVELGRDVVAHLRSAEMWDDPPVSLEDRIARAVASEAALGGASPVSVRRTSWLRPALLGAAAAIVVLIVGIAVLSALGGAPDREQVAVALESTGLVDGVSGDVEMTAFESGLRIDLDAPSLPRRDRGEFYEGWVRTVDDRLVSVGTFHDGDRVTLWAGVPLRDVVRFAITREIAELAESPGQASSGEAVLFVEFESD